MRPASLLVSLCMDPARSNQGVLSSPPLVYRLDAPGWQISWLQAASLASVLISLAHLMTLIFMETAGTPATSFSSHPSGDGGPSRKRVSPNSRSFSPRKRMEALRDDCEGVGGNSSPPQDLSPRRITVAEALFAGLLDCDFCGPAGVA